MASRHPTARLRFAITLAVLVALPGCAQDNSLAGIPAQPRTTPNQNATLLLRYCDKMRVQGNLQMAAAVCQRALEHAPTDQKALLSLGLVLEEMSAPRDAARAYRRVLALNPAHEAARYRLGKAYLLLGQYDMAEQQLEIAMANGNATARVYSTLGVVQDKLGKHDAAQLTYHDGLSRFQDDVALRTNLGLSLVLSGNHAEGLARLREVASDPAAGAPSRQGLAFAYAIAGDMAAAETVALIDLPEEAVAANLAHYQSLRIAGVGNPQPEPAAPSLAASPIPLLPGSSVALAAPEGPDSVVCQADQNKPICGGKR